MGNSMEVTQKLLGTAKNSSSFLYSDLRSLRQEATLYLRVRSCLKRIEETPWQLRELAFAEDLDLVPSSHPGSLQPSGTPVRALTPPLPGIQGTLHTSGTHKFTQAHTCANR